MFSHRYFLRTKLVALCALGALIAPAAALAAEATEHETPSLKAVPLFQIGEFSVTNSMLGLVDCRAGGNSRSRRSPPGISKPSRPARKTFGNGWWKVSRIFSSQIIGRELVQKTFWFFATIFIFILFTNWADSFQGSGPSAGDIIDPTTGAFRIDRPLMRGANADLNMTSAMAVIFFVLWLIWALQANGIGGFLMHLFGPKGETSGVLKILMVVVFFLVGWLEIISILFRPVSLSFRLFGNIYAGESILDAMSHMVPALGLADSNSVLLFGDPGGFVQALVFMLLTAIFTLLIAQHSPGEEAH